jgi:hypothetical protein
MFRKGWKGGPGRPKNSKSTLPQIRDRLFRILLRRIVRDKDLESVSTSELIRFASAVLPKDMSLSVNRDPVIQYYSNVPRPELESQVKTVVAGEVEEEDKQDSEAGN